jgi:hypothetical protein
MTAARAVFFRIKFIESSFMPSPSIHAEIASNATASSMFGLAAIGQTLGLDYVAMFYAFMGAVCWRAMQPRLAPTYNEISAAFGWAVTAMMFGSLGAVWIEAGLLHQWGHIFKNVTHPAMVGLPAFILSFFIVFIFTRITKFIQEWRQP